jgi:hypothetical protein
MTGWPLTLSPSIVTSAMRDDDLRVNFCLLGCDAICYCRQITDVSKGHVTSIFRVELCSNDTSATQDEDLRVNFSVFWVVTLYILVNRYRRFERTCCFHLQGLIV